MAVLTPTMPPAGAALPPSRSRIARHRRLIVLLAILGLVLCLYVVWWGVFYCYQDRVLFPLDLTHRPQEPMVYRQAVVLTAPVETGGVVEALFIPMPADPITGPAPVVIYFHDGTGIADFQDRTIGCYWQMGFSVLVPEYRGYSRSAGVPSEEAIRRDMVSFYDQLAARKDVARDVIIFHGRALGGGVAADLAEERPPRAMILESTFESVRAMAGHFAAPSILVTNPFRTDRVVEHFHHPLLIFHGTNDDVIPVSHGRSLRDLADPAQVTYVEYPCEHDNFPGAGNSVDYWRQIGEFLRRVGLVRLVAGPDPRKHG